MKKPTKTMTFEELKTVIAFKTYVVTVHQRLAQRYLIKASSAEEAQRIYDDGEYNGDPYDEDILGEDVIDVREVSDDGD